jgi:hypothetical protein
MSKPFSPMVTTYSMWSKFRNCRKAVDWRYNQNLAPLERDRYLHFGSLMHECLEIWHRHRDLSLVLDHIDRSCPDRLHDGAQKRDWHLAAAMMRAYATFVGNPVVGQDSTGIQVTQSYIPPYSGVGDFFTIGDFEGVEAAVELADGTILYRGKHPYTAQWDSPGNNVDAVRVAVPKPAALPATIYLHMMAYSPRDRQKFKKVVHDGVPTVHAHCAIATVTITEQALELTAPTITSVVPAYRAIPGSAAKEFRLDITLSRVPSGGAWPLERRPAH